MDILQVIKDEFFSLENYKFRGYKYALRLCDKEKEFLDTLNEKQKELYNKLQDLENKKSLDDMEDAIEYTYTTLLKIVRDLNCIR